MNQRPTANQLRGRATGALFFTVFGALWIILALYIKQMTTPGNLTLVSAGLAILLTAILWLYRRSKSFAKVPEDPVQSRAFNRINIIQWIAIIIVAITFERLHINDYALSAVAAIIGMHLFPLARLFRYPLHYATGSALVAWGAVSALAIPREHIQGTTALGTGLQLWSSSAITLAMALRTALRKEPSGLSDQTMN